MTYQVRLTGKFTARFSYWASAPKLCYWSCLVGWMARRNKKQQQLLTDEQAPITIQSGRSSKESFVCCIFIRDGREHDAPTGKHYKRTKLCFLGTISSIIKTVHFHLDSCCGLPVGRCYYQKSSWKRAYEAKHYLFVLIYRLFSRALFMMALLKLCGRKH